MRRACRERFPRHRLHRKLVVSDPSMHHGTCVTHVPWCMSGSLTLGGGENIPGIPGACATPNFTYLARGPCWCARFSYCQVIITDYMHHVPNIVDFLPKKIPQPLLPHNNAFLMGRAWHKLWIASLTPEKNNGTTWISIHTAFQYKSAILLTWQFPL